jgi:hypothetical protein
MSLTDRLHALDNRQQRSRRLGFIAAVAKKLLKLARESRAEAPVSSAPQWSYMPLSLEEGLSWKKVRVPTLLLNSRLSSACRDSTRRA